jgi:hypothetical protein
MTIKDEILEELRKRTPLEDIRRKYRSQSQFYEALRKFLVEVDKVTEEKQNKLEAIGARLLEAESECERIDSVNRELSKQTEELDRTKQKLTKEVAQKIEELDNLCAEIKGLQRKGFTAEIVRKIKVIEDRSGSDLLSQVKTVEKYNYVKREVSSLTEQKDGLDREIQALERKQRKMDERVVSQKNKFDALKLQTLTFKRAVEVATSFLKDGYTPENLESLKYGVELLKIREDPTLSIERLVSGLSKHKGLFMLDKKLRERRGELALLEKAVGDAEAKLEVIRELTLGTIEETRDAALEAIKKTSNQNDASSKSMMEKLESQVTEYLSRIDGHVEQTMGTLRASLDVWSELQKQKGKLEDEINYGLILLGVLQSPEYLKKIPASLAAQLLDRLRLWTEMNLPNVKITPSKNVSNKELSLSPWQNYKLSALIECASEGLQQILMSSTK